MNGCVLITVVMVTLLRDVGLYGIILTRICVLLQIFPSFLTGTVSVL
jgi:hypothetical protein